MKQTNSAVEFAFENVLRDRRKKRLHRYHIPKSGKNGVDRFERMKEHLKKSNSRSKKPAPRACYRISDAFEILSNMPQRLKDRFDLTELQVGDKKVIELYSACSEAGLDAIVTYDETIGTSPKLFVCADLNFIPQERP